MDELVFWTCAAVSVVSALLVVTRRNPVYCALFLVVTFLALAVAIVPLQAPFLAIMHILVYTGAIMVLFLFIIMLLNLSASEIGREYPLRFRLFVGAISTATFAVFATVFASSPLPAPAQVSKEFGGVNSVGTRLFEAFVLPFELVSILILVAVFGAVVLAAKKEHGES